MVNCQFQHSVSQQDGLHNRPTRTTDESVTNNSWFSSSLISASLPTPVDGVKPFCCEPRIIVNTKLPSFFCEFGNLLAFDIYCKQVSYVIPRCIVNEPSVKVKKADLLRWLSSFIRKSQISYFVCEDSGEMMSSTMYVECGKCACCLERKRHHFSSLCEMESQQHDKLPLFITLTYHDDNLPCEGLRNSDVQKYFKRIRRTLDKRHISHNLRYAYCGEYGSQSRPHYHVLLYGFPEDSFTNFLKVEFFLRKKWNLGFVLIKPVDNVTNVAKYIGKYMTKAGKQTPDCYEIAPFVRHSVNMGVDFVRSVVTPVAKNGYQQLFYKDKFSGKLCNLPFTKYYINKVYPGVSQCKVEDRNSNLLYTRSSLFGDSYFASELRPYVDMSSYVDNQVIRDRWYQGLFDSLPDISPVERAYNLSKSHDRLLYKQTC